MADDNDKDNVPTKSSGAKSSTTEPKKDWVMPSPADLAAMRSAKSGVTASNIVQPSQHRILPLTPKEYEQQKSRLDGLINSISGRIDLQVAFIKALDFQIKKLGNPSITDPNRMTLEKDLASSRAELPEMYSDFFKAKHEREELEKRNPANKTQQETVSSTASLSTAKKARPRGVFFQPGDEGHASLKDELKKLAKAGQKSGQPSDESASKPSEEVQKENTGPKLTGGGG